jgi:membrane-bound lytic murein transglycosylase D
MKSRIFFLILVSVWPLWVKAEVPVLQSLLVDPTQVYREGQVWVATKFREQGEALGLEQSTFKPPKNLEKAVAFWIRVYTEYQSNQGVLHDLENLGIVYEKLDFDFINKNESLTERQKSKAREHYVDERKKATFASLIKISSGAPETELSEEDRAIKTIWEKEGGLAALKAGADMGRLRFQLGQSDRIKEAIYLSGRYLPMMEKIFKNEGLPMQLTRLVFVESSFNVLARSKVGASGLWQIMPSAARGRLRMNRVIDLRNHPQEATELAAKMLRFNYEMLGAWPLAITGYNHGPYGVKRLVERNRTRDLGELIETGEGRRFGFASRNFFASFLAALEVESKAAEFFPGIRQAFALNFEELQLEKSIVFSDLVKAFGGNKEMAQLYNPHLQRLAYQDRVRLDSKSRVVVPVEILSEVEKTLAGIVGKVASDKTEYLESHRKPSSKKEAIAGVGEPKKYKVNKGDTLYRISRQFGISIRSILSLNDLKGPKSIKAGQILHLP